MTAQIIEIAGQRMAILPMVEYERLLEVVEERADGEAAARAEARRDAGEEYVPVELIDQILAGENALRVWRKYRGLTAVQLSGMSGIDQSRISELENGKAQGRPATWRALAQALDVSVDDILPLA